MYTRILNTEGLRLLSNPAHILWLHAFYVHYACLIHELVYCYIPNFPNQCIALTGNNLSSVKCGSNALQFSAKPYRTISMSVFVRTC